MRLITMILIIISGVVGFVFSYGYAYRQVSGVLYSSTASMQSSTSFSTDR